MNNKRKNMVLPVVLGKTANGEIFVKDLVDYPHILIAGVSGQGKTTCVNAIVASLLQEKTPDEVKFVFASSFRMQLSHFESLDSSFMARVPDNGEKIFQDFDEVLEMLKWLHEEMDNRYELMKSMKAEDFEDTKLPHIICVIDEYADYMMTDEEFEKEIVFMASLCGRVGIHLILTTMRPTESIVTPRIRVHFPIHIAFKLYHKEESEIMLGKEGAENLSEPGDMLMRVDDEVIRLQGILVEDNEITAVTL